MLLLLALGLAHGGDKGCNCVLGEEEEEEGAGLSVSVDSAKRERCTVIAGVLPPTAPLQAMLPLKMQCQPHIPHPVLPRALACPGKH